MSIKRNMKKTISSDIYSIGEVLRDNYFKIPFYQRDYAWGKSQIDDLWNDLIDLVDGTRDDHFFGQIVTYDDEDNQAVIDGQQRITTSSILMASIKYFAIDLLQSKKIDDKSMTDLRVMIRDVDDYMKTYDDDGLTLTLQRVSSNNDAIQDYFVKLIGGNYTMNPNEKKLMPIKNINKAFVKLKNNIKDLLGKHEIYDQIKLLRKLLDTFTYQFFVSMVETEKQGDAFTIFESLNSTGKDLAPSEIIKTYLMSQVSKESDEIRSEFNDKWSKLEFKFDKKSDRVTNFIRTYWTARAKLVGKKQLYRSISKQIIGSDKTQEFLDDLLKISDYYLVVDNGCQNKRDINIIEDSQILSMLWMMNKMGCVTYYPVLFSMKLRDYDIASIRKVVHKILCVFTRTITICGYGTNSLEPNFALIAEDIWRQAIVTPDEINKRMTETIMPKNYEITSAFQSLSMEDRQGPKGWSIKYVLFCIYKYYGDFEDVSLNKIGEKKYNVLKIDGAESTDDHNTNGIGNYVLIEASISSDIADEYTVKDIFPILAKSQLKSNKRLVEFIKQEGTWDHDGINGRQNDWANVISNIW